jgi:LPS-assembly lipoprotein
MSLFNNKKHLFNLLISVFLVGCSFQPAWVAKNQNAKILWQRIDFKEAKTSNEFGLNQYLASRLGKGDDAELFLKYELFTETKRSALSFDGKAYRIRIHGEVKFSLIQNGKNTILLTSSVSDSAAYSDAILAVTDEASERDAYARLMVLLGDRIVDKLLSSETLYDET